MASDQCKLSGSVIFIIFLQQLYLRNIILMVTYYDRGTALHAGRSWVRFPLVSLEFFIDIILPAALWPWGRLSLRQKSVPGIFPGGKGGRCVGLTILPLSGAACLEIWEPQPPGTLRAPSRPVTGLLLRIMLSGTPLSECCSIRTRNDGILLFVISMAMNCRKV